MKLKLTFYTKTTITLLLAVGFLFLTTKIHCQEAVVSPGAYLKYDFHREKSILTEERKHFSQTKVGLFLKEMKPTKWDWIAFGLLAIEGVTNGAIDAVRKDPDVFERKFGIGDYDWGGSEDWQRNYENNRYLKPDGGINRHKSELLGNFGRDFDHTAKDIRKWTARFGASAFTVGLVIDIKSKEPILPRLAKGLLIAGTSSFVEQTTYQILTK